MAARSRNGSVTEGSLDQMDWSTALQAVGRMGVPQPVRANMSINPGSLGCLLRNAQNSRSIQWLAGAGAENWRVNVASGSQALQVPPHCRRQHNSAGLSTLARDRELASISRGAQVAPT